MDLRELYQEVILDHNKRPRNRGAVDGHNHAADGHNPLCGDEVHITARVEDGRVVDVAFDGKGCAISTASASLMTEALKGKTLDEVETAFEAFHDLITTQVEPDLEALGKLAVFAGVREFPMRVKCATLAWHTVRAALDDGSTVSTE